MDTSPPPPRPVSSLRNKWEQLANANSSTASAPQIPKKRVISQPYTPSSISSSNSNSDGKQENGEQSVALPHSPKKTPRMRTMSLANPQEEPLIPVESMSEWGSAPSSETPMSASLRRRPPPPPPSLSSKPPGPASAPTTTSSSPTQSNPDSESKASVKSLRESLFGNMDDLSLPGTSNVVANSPRPRVKLRSPNSFPQTSASTAVSTLGVDLGATSLHKAKAPALPPRSPINVTLNLGLNSNSIQIHNGDNTAHYSTPNLSLDTSTLSDKAISEDFDSNSEINTTLINISPSSPSNTIHIKEAASPKAKIPPPIPPRYGVRGQSRTPSPSPSPAPSLSPSLSASPSSSPIQTKSADQELEQSPFDSEELIPDTPTTMQSQPPPTHPSVSARPPLPTRKQGTVDSYSSAGSSSHGIIPTSTAGTGLNGSVSSLASSSAPSITTNATGSVPGSANASVHSLNSPPPLPLSTRPSSAISALTSTSSSIASSVLASASTSSLSAASTNPPGTAYRVPPSHPHSAYHAPAPQHTPVPPPPPPTYPNNSSPNSALHHIPSIKSYSAPPPLSYQRSLTLTSALPPPPMRTVPLGTVPPPLARRQRSGSASSSSEEEGTHTNGKGKENDKGKDKERKLELFPDSSHSSRRPPRLGLPYPSSVPFPLSHGHGKDYGNGHVVRVQGPLVVFASGCNVRCYHLKACAWIGECEIPHSHGVKDRKVTAMEFAPHYPTTSESSTAGRVWIGTKDGALFLISISLSDPGSGNQTSLHVIDQRAGWHAHPIVHLIREGEKMVSVDDGGKVVCFFGSSDYDGKRSPTETGSLKPHASFRTPASSGSGVGWVGVMGGKVWCAYSSSSAGVGVKIYDLTDPNVRPIVASASVAFEQHSGGSGVGTIGPILGGTIISSRPNRVYLGHEGGIVSTWFLPPESDEKARSPRCVAHTKIGVSDVLCIAGVHDRLWTGGRRGIISVHVLPPLSGEEGTEEEGVGEMWKVTNQFQAHDDAPLVGMWVDPHSVEQMGRMAVVSVGRDERVSFWDGLLGADWIDEELAKQESKFSTFRPLNVLLCTWNVDAARPDQLSGTVDNSEFLQKCLASVERPDIICFGFQEVIDLESRKLTAKTVLLGSRKKKTDASGSHDGISEKVTRAYKRWHDALVLAVRLAMPPDDPYTVVHTENLVGLFTCIFVRNSQKKTLTDIHITTVKRGMKGLYGNKGAIVARFVIDDSSISFINCHLAAGQNHRRQRNNDLAAILEEKSVFPSSGSLDIDDDLAYVGGGDGSMILDHEICFLNGDLNYRIDHRRENVVQSIYALDHTSLLPYDQLLKEMKNNPGFRLRTFTEAPITFAPTYKYDPFSSTYDSSEKKRMPAWCDRILYRCRDLSRVRALNYQRYEANVSDHRPVSAGYTITVKRINHEVRANVKAELDEAWQLEEHKLLLTVRDWFRTQRLVF